MTLCCLLKFLLNRMSEGLSHFQAFGPASQVEHFMDRCIGSTSRDLRSCTGLVMVPVSMVVMVVPVARSERGSRFAAGQGPGHGPFADRIVARRDFARKGVPDRGLGRLHRARGRRGLLHRRDPGEGLPVHPKDAVHFKRRRHVVGQGPFGRRSRGHDCLEEPLCAQRVTHLRIK